MSQRLAGWPCLCPMKARWNYTTPANHYAGHFVQSELIFNNVVLWMYTLKIHPAHQTAHLSFITIMQQFRCGNSHTPDLTDTCVTKVQSLNKYWRQSTLSAALLFIISCWATSNGGSRCGIYLKFPGWRGSASAECSKIIIPTLYTLGLFRQIFCDRAADGVTSRSK